MQEQVLIVSYEPNGSNYNLKDIEFKKYAKFRLLSKHLQNLLRFSFCKNNYFIGKNVMKTISYAFFWPVSNKYVYEI